VKKKSVLYSSKDLCYCKTSCKCFMFPRRSCETGTETKCIIIQSHIDQCLYSPVCFTSCAYCVILCNRYTCSRLL